MPSIRHYSVKVRSYRQVGGQTYYGAWSSVKTVTPKASRTFVGTWILQSGSNISADKAKEARLNGRAVTATVKKNGKCVVNINGKKGTYKWVKISKTKARMTRKHYANITITLKGDKLLMKEKGVTLTMI